MFPRLLQMPADESCLLLGPRGTGKSFWARNRYPDATYIDLLDSAVFQMLVAEPARLETLVPAAQTTAGGGHRVVLDEVQRIPALLDEVHRLIEARGLRFTLTGSSARKLRRGGVNLLAGRARTRFLHPLIAAELGAAFSLEHSLRFGCLPTVYGTGDPGDYLASYVSTYLREEVQQEGLTRNLPAFTRFLEAASFSQGAVLNVAAVARECAVDRKLAAGYFTLLEDLLLAVRIPPFTKRAQRALVAHPKFFFFDAGVYRAIRPKGPLDAPAEIDGHALETLLMQHLRAVNDYERAGYELFYWRTRTGLEVDFVLYGERGIRCFEIKRARDVRGADLRGLQAFRVDYPMAKATVFYGGKGRRQEDGIAVVPFEEGIVGLAEFLA